MSSSSRAISRISTCKARVAVKTLPTGGGQIYRYTEKGWETFLEYGQEDSITTQPLVIESDGQTALLLSAAGRDKAALVRVDLASGKQSVVGESDAGGRRRRVGRPAHARAAGLLG